MAKWPNSKRMKYVKIFRDIVHSVCVCVEEEGGGGGEEGGGRGEGGH